MQVIHGSAENNYTLELFNLDRHDYVLPAAMRAYGPLICFYPPCDSLQQTNSIPPARPLGDRFIAYIVTHGLPS